MRDASVQLQASIASEVTTLARLWRVQRKDGTVLRFTDAVQPINIQLPGDTSVQTYRSDVSFTSSAIFTSSSYANQQSVTLTFLLDDTGFSEGDLRARQYDGATSQIHVVDYTHPEYGTILWFSGTFGIVRLSDQKIGTVEILPLAATLGTSAIGTETYSATCRNALGDAICKINLTALKMPFTVTSASGGSVVSAALNQASGYWSLGFVKWLTGKNAGKTSQVQSNDQGSTSLFLLSPPFYPIQAGDTAEVYPGCDKQRQTCINKFANLQHMRAEPDVPNGSKFVPNVNINNMPIAG